MRPARRFLLVAALAGPLDRGAAAQELMRTPIGFRSGLTEGAVTTRPGTLTIDAGASARWTGGATLYRVGEFNIRVPLSSRVEGRLYANSYAWRDSGTRLDAGREDLSLAVATMLLAHHRLRPVTAVILRLDTPTGSVPGREHSWRPSARWSFGWELPGRVALHANLGIAHDTRGGVGYAREVASLWVSRRLAGALGGYAEVFGSTRERPSGHGTGYLHGGLTYLLLPWMHLDLHAGAGSAGAGSPRWIGIGVRQRA